MRVHHCYDKEAEICDLSNVRRLWRPWQWHSSKSLRWWWQRWIRGDNESFVVSGYSDLMMVRDDHMMLGPHHIISRPWTRDHHSLREIKEKLNNANTSSSPAEHLKWNGNSYPHLVLYLGEGMDCRNGISLSNSWRSKYLGSNCLFGQLNVKSVNETVADCNCFII